MNLLRFLLTFFLFFFFVICGFEQTGHLKVVKYLFEKGAKVDQAFDLDTLLWIAASVR